MGKLTTPQHGCAKESTTCVCPDNPTRIAREIEEKDNEKEDEDQEEDDESKKYGPTCEKATGPAKNKNT